MPRVNILEIILNSLFKAMSKPQRRRPVRGLSQVSAEAFEDRRLLSALVANVAANDTRGTAENLGVIDGTTIIRNGSVGGSDPVDFYRFIPRSGSASAVTVEFGLSGMSRDLDVQIQDSTGRVLASGTRSGTNAESFSANLQAGSTYYVRVYPYGSGAISNYRLSVATPAAGNDSMATAENLGTIRATTRVINGSVGGTDPVDYFRFVPQANALTLTGRMNVTISLSGMSRDLDLYVYDASGREIARGIRGGTASESLTVSMSQGSTYYVRVVPYGTGAVSNYRLSITTPRF